MPTPDIERKHVLRSKGGYIPFKNTGEKFNKSFFPYFANLWNNSPKNVKCKQLADFKDYTNRELKPPRYKHFGRGKKENNRLLTKIRVGRSELNQHKFTIGQVDSPQCLCFHREESPKHFFLECFLYSPERQILFGIIEHHIPQFSNYSKHKKLDLILRGYNPDNDEFLQLNTTLKIAVQSLNL